MDTLSHGLWGGAVFGQKGRGLWKWAFFWGMAPDLFSFGPFFLAHIPMLIQRILGHQRWEPPDPRLIPAYVYHAYNVTHSLFIWVLTFLIVWIISGRLPWVLGAWGLHILCDIPTHGTRFFPTPYLWPFHTHFVNGYHWARPAFMLANYALIGLTYLGIWAYKRLVQKHN